MQHYKDTAFSTRPVMPLGGATVLVQTTAGALASIYSDNLGTTKSNPFTTDDGGAYDFYAADGRYNITIAKDGYTTQVIRDVLLFDPATSSPTSASSITNVPAGNISSTTVQTALNELDSEKVGYTALATQSGAGLVGNTPAGNITSTTTQAALNELDGFVSALQLADYTALRAYTGTRKSVYVTGYLATSAPSGIAGMFVRDDNDTTTADDGGMVIVTSGGKRYKRQSDYVTPEFYGAKGDGATDDTTAITAVATRIRTVGTGFIRMGAGKTYYVLPTGGSSGAKLMDFTNVAGLGIEGNGARILTGSVTLNQMAVCLDGASLVRMANMKFESGYQSLTSSAGIDWIVAGNGAHELLFENIDLKWGVCGICPRGPAVGSGTDSNRTRNVIVRNLTTFGTYYPVNLQGAGDNFTGNIRSRNAGRSFFAYNVRNCDVTVDSEHGGPFSDVLIKCYGSTSFDSRTDNIKVRYATRTRYAGSGNQNADEALVAIDLQLNGTNPAAAHIQDVDITFDVDASPTDKMQSLFVIRKYDSSGTADGTASRGHELINLTLRGTGRSLQNLLGDAIRLFTRTPDNWTGESIYNVRVDGSTLGMSAGQKAITLDGSGLAGACTIRDVVSAGNLTYTNTAGKDFAVDTSSFGNYSQFTRVPKDYTATWTADTTAPSLGTGTLQTKYSVRNGWCTVTGKLSLGATTTTGSGNWHISLPFTHSNSDYAVEGSAKGLAGGSFYTGVCEVQPNASTLELMLGGTTGNYVNASTPNTWGSGHHVEFTITYPIA